MDKEQLYLFMEDFDNDELDDYDRAQQLMDAVVTFNEQEGTDYDRFKALGAYKHWVYKKYQPDQ